MAGKILIITGADFSRSEIGTIAPPASDPNLIRSWMGGYYSSGNGNLIHNGEVDPHTQQSAYGWYTSGKITVSMLRSYVLQADGAGDDKKVRAMYFNADGTFVESRYVNLNTPFTPTAPQMAVNVRLSDSHPAVADTEVYISPTTPPQIKLLRHTTTQ